MQPASRWTPRISRCRSSCSAWVGMPGTTARSSCRRGPSSHGDRPTWVSLTTIGTGWCWSSAGTSSATSARPLDRRSGSGQRPSSWRSRGGVSMLRWPCAGSFDQPHGTVHSSLDTRRSSRAASQGHQLFGCELCRRGRSRRMGRDSSGATWAQRGCSLGGRSDEAAPAHQVSNSGIAVEDSTRMRVHAASPEQLVCAASRKAGRRMRPTLSVDLLSTARADSAHRVFSGEPGRRGGLDPVECGCILGPHFEAHR
jgi:hypothetical protein